MKESPKRGTGRWRRPEIGTEVDVPFSPKPGTVISLTENPFRSKSEDSNLLPADIQASGKARRPFTAARNLEVGGVTLEAHVAGTAGEVPGLLSGAVRWSA